MSRIRRMFVALSTNVVWRRIALVTGAALALRLAVFVYLLMYGGEAALFTGDSLRYLSLADSVLAGTGYQYEGVVESFRAPGYPAYLAFFQVLNIPFWVASFMQILLSAGIAGWTVWFSKNHLGLSLKVASVIGAFVALEPIQIYYSVLLLPDVSFTIAAIAAFTFTLLAVERGDMRFAVYAGVAVGLGNYVRPAMLYLPAFLIVFVVAYAWWTRGNLKRAVTHGAIILAVSFIVMSPWYIRNQYTFGHFKFVSAKDYTMYAYVAAATKAAAENRTYESVKQELLAEARMHAPSASRETFENSEYYNTQARAILKQHPLRFLKLYAIGLTTFWTSGNYQYLLKSVGLLDRPSESVSYSMLLATEGPMKAGREFISRIGEPFILVALFDRVLWLGIFLLSLLGLVLWRFNTAAWLTALYFAYFSATILSTAIGVEARHRYALIPLMIAYAIGALVTMYRYVRAR